METEENGSSSVKKAASGIKPVLSPEVEEYVQQCEAELRMLDDTGGYQFVRTLAERELSRLKSGEVNEHGHVLVHRDNPLKIMRKIHVPTKEFPTINFAGRLIGPKGATLKNLQSTTKVNRLMVLGKGSNFDKASKEEEAKLTGDVSASEDLYVYTEIFAFPVEAYARFAHLMNELKKYFDPTIGYGALPAEKKAATAAAAAGIVRPPMGFRMPIPGMMFPMLRPPMRMLRPFGAGLASGAAAMSDDSSFYDEAEESANESGDFGLGGSKSAAEKAAALAYQAGLAAGSAAAAAGYNQGMDYSGTSAYGLDASSSAASKAGLSPAGGKMAGMQRFPRAPRPSPYGATGSF